MLFIPPESTLHFRLYVMMFERLNLHSDSLYVQLHPLLPQLRIQGLLHLPHFTKHSLPKKVRDLSVKMISKPFENYY
jgi:hypothetical protein